MKPLFCAILPIAGFMASCEGTDVAAETALLYYIPEAQCADAKFELLEEQEGVQDWYYQVRISGSGECLSSIKSHLDLAGAEQSSIPLIQGRLLPGKTDPETEAVAFDFESEPGKIIWTRDKR